MPFANEHSARVKDPHRFRSDTFRRITLISPNSHVSLVIGKLKGDANTTVESYRFPANWYSPEAAKLWLRQNNVRYKKFEPALNSDIRSINN